MELISNLAFFVVGILISAVCALFICRKLIRVASLTATANLEAERSTLLVQLEASQKRSTEISSEVSDRERRIERLVDERGQEIARRSAAEEQTKRIPELERQISETRERLDATSIRLVELEKQKSELTTTLEKDREALFEKVQLVDDAKKQLSGMFAELSAVALQSNNQQFMNLAKQTLEGFQEGARVDLEQRQKTIADLVSPVKLSLDKVDLKIQEMEIARAGAYEGLKQQMTTLAATEQGLRTETSNLVKALRSPKVRGVWGEMQLRRVIELAGMLEHCDFVEQDSVNTEQGLLRPDVLIRMPGGKTVVVDSKAPLEAYLEAIALDDDTARNLKLKDHARQVRNHITALGKKSYSDAFQTTPDYVVLFVPGEAFYTAAIDQDPALIEYGLEKGVILAAPTTLIALLKAVAYGWREESLKENALKISELGRELYDRLLKMGGHVTKLGRALGNAVESYNSTIGSLENRVLVTARKFKDLSVTNGNGAEIEQLDPIERVPRLLQAAEFSSPAEPTLTQ
jgi:DNA recombination protein RmuC